MEKQEELTLIKKVMIWSWKIPSTSKWTPSDYLFGFSECLQECSDKFNPYSGSQTTKYGGIAISRKAPPALLHDYLFSPSKWSRFNRKKIHHRNEHREGSRRKKRLEENLVCGKIRRLEKTEWRVFRRRARRKIDRVDGEAAFEVLFDRIRTF